jgi:hypothetical protein
MLLHPNLPVGLLDDTCSCAFVHECLYALLGGAAVQRAETMCHLTLRLQGTYDLADVISIRCTPRSPSVSVIGG